MSEFEWRFRTSVRPRRIGSGELAFAIPGTLIRNRHELALTVGFITKRYLFGLAYRGLQPDYFDEMPPDSGVYVCPAVPTSELAPGTVRPGDIDLLVIPYERDELVLHRTLALEIKALRASFSKQAKSPNQIGFSQASGLLGMGFPYVAVAHLIVSDESPRDAWRSIGVARVVGPGGLAEILPNTEIDYLPVDLIDRTFGRLSRAATRSEVGLVAAYVGSREADLTGGAGPVSTWHPECRPALPNPAIHVPFLERVAAFFETRPTCFLDNPRFDPV